MINKTNLRFALAFAALFSIFNVSLPTNVAAQQAESKQTATTAAADLQKAVAVIREKTEAKRREYGIPGIGLAIVKDGEVVFMEGFGYKNFEKKVPVTADTQFAIGSSTKAFTALSVLMSQDEGKLSLDDSPKKHLPYFKINDPEIDRNITVRDLMAHSSGLNRTDLGWITGKLTREEIIRVAGEAKPMAKLREKFFYQNVMFVTAGEIVARVQKQPWEKFVPEKIFKPLGMTNSTMSLKEMQKAKDFSNGYDYNFDTKETRNLPLRDIDEVAPAGSINSSARDMTQWLKFVLNRGELNGKRLVSEKGFDEWTKLQMNITPNGKIGYGLGWFVRDWNGMKVVEHGGNIDGFNALVAMIPEKKLGFVMLTNVSGSNLGSDLMPIVWENILGKSNAAAAAAPTQTATSDLVKEVGKYRFDDAGFDVEIKMQDGKLVAVVPGQPLYTLESTGARTYKLNGAPDGYFISFKNGEAYLEQPNGNFILPRVKPDGSVDVKIPAPTAKELIGKYESEAAKGNFVEVSESGGIFTLNIAGQQPYELNEKAEDSFRLLPLPESYSLKVVRDAAGKISGIAIVQPEGEFKFNSAGAGDTKNTVTMTVDELMAKTVDALGGDANWRKLNSRTTKFEMDFENQGVKGTGTSFEKAANMTTTEITLNALGKQIADWREYFDGAAGGEWTSFSPAETFTGQRLEDVKHESDFYGLANWKSGLKKAEIRGTEKVDGEDAYVVKIQPEKASGVTYYISTKTFLPVKKESIVVSSTSAQKTPVSETFSDYRAVDGVMIPFKTKSLNPGMGMIVTYIKEVKHNQQIDDTVFKTNGKKTAAKR